MAYTALVAVNRILKRTRVISGDSGDLTSFTDPQHQHSIDIALQTLNEIMQLFYGLGVLSGEVKESSITLVDATREYAAATDFEQMAGDTYQTRVMVNASSNNRLYEYPGGYPRMFLDQPDPTDWTGRPLYWAWQQQSKKFRLDRTPTSAEAGEVYKYLYEFTNVISATGDTFPFTDSIFNLLLPGIAETWGASVKSGSKHPVYATSAFNMALHSMPNARQSNRYGVQRGYAA